MMPLISFLTLLLDIFNLFSDGNIEANDAYVWLSLAHIVTIILSMVNMHRLMFFVKDDLEALPATRAPAKFWCIKAVVFLSFLQGLVIAILFAIAHVDVVALGLTAADVQGFCICIELALLSAVHRHYFSHTEFVVGSADRLSFIAASRDAFMSSDFVRDTYNTFNTTPSAEANRNKRDLTDITFSESDALLPPPHASHAGEATYQSQ